MNYQKTLFWLNELINSSSFIHFYKKIQETKKNRSKPYKSYIGLNIEEKNLLSIKFYFTFLHEISFHDIENILGENGAQIFYKDYENRHINNDPTSGGAGFTFSLKYSFEEKTPIKGLYFMVKCDQEEFTRLEESKKFLEKFGYSPKFNPKKLIYKAFKDTESEIETRELFYISDFIFKKFLSEYFDEPYLQNSHEIELSCGKEKYRKVNLLLNLPDFKENYSKTVRGKKIESALSSLPIFKNYTAVCPGIYQKSEIDSIYLINTDTIQNQDIQTIEIFKDEMASQTPKPSNNDNYKSILKKLEFVPKNINEYDFDVFLNYKKVDVLLHSQDLTHIENLCNYINSKKIIGDIVECGVWKGGSAILLRSLLDETWKSMNRKMWLADFFGTGFDFDQENMQQKELTTFNKASEFKINPPQINEVKNFLCDFGILDETTNFLIGNINKTLHKAQIESICLLHLDLDFYASTKNALNMLYEKVSVGGLILINDYNVKNLNCKEAILDFRKSSQITNPLIEIGDYLAYWIKS
ncbi:MAG: TylF/MycF family methyltransferase [Bacteroidia bacterium]|nr:TylF/MycF family methyltransferase [Bacteroidia bacterium]MCF8427066.1 TylF/MycF family methyltransferase [Bacteroidia bacterium]MCF8446888.1 TylF/MycF family methyltransferase [Bacteroidia bacterium]